MVPGITDTECRIAEFRSRDLRATAERQRMAVHAHPARSNRAGLNDVISRQVCALAGGMRRRLAGIRSPETAARTATLGVGR